MRTGHTLRLIACVAAGAAMQFTASTAGAADTKLPAAVAKALNENASMCTEAGGKALTDKAVKRVDLNGDGKEDYVLDVGSINCEGAASIYGDREKGVMVFVGDGAGGAKEAFKDMTFGVNLDGSKLWLTTMAEGCGKKPAADFASENFCERAIVWNPKTNKFDYAPVSTVKMIQ